VKLLDKKKEILATYTEPKTTDANIVEINLDGNNYTTPNNLFFKENSD
jgi:hypothetical protein